MPDQVFNAVVAAIFVVVIMPMLAVRMSVVVIVYVIVYMIVSMMMMIVMRMFVLIVIVSTVRMFVIVMLVFVVMVIMPIMLMSMIVMVMIMRLFFLPVYHNFYARSGYPAFDRRFGAYSHIGNTNAVQPAQEFFGVVMQFQQGGHQHVARRAHGTFKVQCFHACLLWFIMLAKYPAPNPLSMLTTLTPLAQELSMVSRAASPLNDAP